VLDRSRAEQSVLPPPHGRPAGDGAGILRRGQGWRGRQGRRPRLRRSRQNRSGRLARLPL